MKKLPLIPAISAAVGTVCVIYYIVCGMLYSFTMSGLWIWLCFGLIMWFGFLWRVIAEPMILRGRRVCAYRSLKTAILSLFALFIAVFFVFEGLVIGKWIEGTASDGSPDAIVILGAGVAGDRPGDALSKRIGTAYDFISDHPDITVIACGGLGEGDAITEADCVENELMRLGIPEQLILTETRSTTTAENFFYAAELLPEETDSVAIVTSGFHQFRACLTGDLSFAKAGITGVELIPVSAPYDSILLPYSMVREFAAFVMDYAHGNVSLG